MTGRHRPYGLEDIHRHRLEIDVAYADSKHDDARRLLAACCGELRIRIGDVVHGYDGIKVGLPRTACGVRWVPGVSDAFPRGVPTEVEVDCMSCLIRMARSK